MDSHNTNHTKDILEILHVCEQLKKFALFCIIEIKSVNSAIYF